MELQEFGPVAQSKALFNEAAASNFKAYKLKGIAAIALIGGFAIWYMYWQQQNTILIRPAAKE